MRFLYILLVAVFIYTPLVGMIFGFTILNVNIDNRPPVMAPLLNGYDSFYMYIKAWGDYFRDRAFLRKEAVIFNHQILRTFGESGSPLVLVGRNGWQYLGSADNIVKKYTGEVRFSNTQLIELHNSLLVLQKYIESKNKNFFILITPSQQVIYPEHLPAYLNKVNSEGQYDQFVKFNENATSKLNLIDIRSHLIDNKGDHILYTKSEGHWNELGAMYSFQRVSEVLYENHLIKRLLSPSDFTLSYSRRSFPPVSFNELYPDVRPRKDIDLVIHGYASIDPNAVEIKSNSNNNIRALVISDSFMPIARQYLGYLFKTSIEVHYNNINIDKKLIDIENADVVLMEVTDRYLDIISERIKVDTFIFPDFLKKVRYSRKIVGAIDQLSYANSKLEVSGWAFSPEKCMAPIYFAVYNDNSLVASDKININRPDVVNPNCVTSKVGFSQIANISRLFDIKSLRFLFFFPDGSFSSFD
jgi:alginate O-acetyltransferase complex protein AlgJ